MTPAGAGGAFDTELPTILAASAHVFEVNERIQGALSSLLSRLEPLTTWQGGAASSFHALKVRWYDDAERLNAALHGIGEALAATQASYAQTDEANQQSFTGIAGSLG
ncbi:MAG: hypothetical protein NVSMB13_18740 [Mycobacteriales bacterium]